MKTAAVIVAAGRGTRAGRAGPKQWEPLAGRRVADWTVAAFDDHPGIAHIALIHHPDDTPDLTAQTPLALVAGGARRDISVERGLAALPEGITHVLIHAVARPGVTGRLISAVIAALAEAPGAAPALPVTDALWRGTDGFVTGTQDRSGLWRAQTPQGFDLAAIRDAHAAKTAPAADDVEVARAAGLAVAIVPGEETNMKITGPEDFARAERILRG